MSLLTVESVSYTFGGTPVLRSIEFQLSRTDHAALVGPNGTGKSTLLSLLSGERLPDAGKIDWLPGTKIGHLSQHLDFADGASLLDVLRSAFAHLYGLEQEMQSVASQMAHSTPEELEGQLRRYAELEEQLAQSGFYHIDTEIERVACGLGLAQLGLDTDVARLSGGQRTKVALARLLLQQADVLLLDEPTNYLDANHVDWLAGYLAQYPHAFLIVSHDTDFLNRVVNLVFHLEHQALTRYKGNYSDFLAAHELRKDQIQLAYRAQQTEIHKLETYIQKNKVRASTAKQAKSREKRLERTLSERIDPPKAAVRPHIRFHLCALPASTVVETRQLLVGYDKPLMPPLNLKLARNSKVAVTGFNGIGKTTLLRTLLGKVQALSGDVVFGDGVRVGYFEQELRLARNQTAIETVWSEFPALSQREVRQALARCGLRGDQVFQSVSSLSGGEQAKVRICRLMLTRVNWLVLDEPTNHLDALAKESLAEALTVFDGAILVVAHEPEFYRDWVTDVWDVSAW